MPLLAWSSAPRCHDAFVFEVEASRANIAVKSKDAPRPRRRENGALPRVRRTPACPALGLRHWARCPAFLLASRFARASTRRREGEERDARGDGVPCDLKPAKERQHLQTFTDFHSPSGLSSFRLKVLYR